MQKQIALSIPAWASESTGNSRTRQHSREQRRGDSTNSERLGIRSKPVSKLVSRTRELVSYRPRSRNSRESISLISRTLPAGLETGGKIIMGLAGMTDEDIDRICQTMSRMNMAPFFFGEWWAIAWETLRWVVKGLPLILRD